MSKLKRVNLAPEPVPVISGNITWKELNANLKRYDEDQLIELLRIECENKKRLQFLLRLHGRFNVLRGQREREELLNCLKTPEA